jgi:hypothetical protein
MLDAADGERDLVDAGALPCVTMRNRSEDAFPWLLASTDLRVDADTSPTLNGVMSFFHLSGVWLMIGFML